MQKEFSYLVFTLIYFSSIVVAVQNIITVAGNGVTRYSGDGGPATQAMLYHPTGVAVSNDVSFLFIVDSGNFRVRKVFLDNGTIITIAGNGVGGYNGDGIATQTRMFPNDVAISNDGSL